MTYEPTEIQCVAYAAPAVVNLLSALAPTVEGLFLVTTLDGKKGKLLLRFQLSQQIAFEDLCNWLMQRYPGGFQIEAKSPLSNSQ
jgi:hypothetical protein